MKSVATACARSVRRAPGLIHANNVAMIGSLSTTSIQSLRQYSDIPDRRYIGEQDSTSEVYEYDRHSMDRIPSYNAHSGRKKTRTDPSKLSLERGRDVILMNLPPDFSWRSLKEAVIFTFGTAAIEHVHVKGEVGVIQRLNKLGINTEYEGTSKTGAVGLIRFFKEADASQAIRVLHHSEMNGYRVLCKKSDGEIMATAQKRAEGDPIDQHGNAIDLNSEYTSIEVDGIPLEITWQQLKAYLAQYGDVKYVALRRSIDSLSQRALVRFATPQIAQETMNKLRGAKINGHPINLKRINVFLRNNEPIVCKPDEQKQCSPEEIKQENERLGLKGTDARDLTVFWEKKANKFRNEITSVRARREYRQKEVERWVAEHKEGGSMSPDREVQEALRGWGSGSGGGGGGGGGNRNGGNNQMFNRRRETMGGGGRERQRDDWDGGFGDETNAYHEGDNHKYNTNGNL